MMRRFQEIPHLLEIAYSVADRLLRPFSRWLRPGSMVDRLLIRTEKVSKGLLFDCRMCGQCVLHSTGMTCPMTCPKKLRNGPCGGVRLDGHCEVIPDMICVWVQAWDRSKRMPTHGKEILKVLPPLDYKLEGTSAWVNDFSGEALKVPPGWDA